MISTSVQVIYVITMLLIALVLLIRNRKLTHENEKNLMIIMELKNAKEQFLSIIEADTDWHWEVDNQGHYTYLSPKVKDAIGYEVDELLGKTPFELMPPDEAVKIGEAFGEIVGSCKPFRNLRNLNLHKNGKEVMLETSGNPIFNENGELVGYRGIDRDVTEQFYTQEKLKEAKIEAENANKAKSEFLANMSHEIRTPLNAVLGFSELLETTKVSAKQQSYLESIQTGAKTLLSIINDILDLSKIEAGKLRIHPGPMMIKSLVEDMQRIFTQPAKDKNLGMNFFIDSNVPYCLSMDETRIRQVLFNLIGNAVKFTHTGQIDILIYSSASNQEGCINLVIDVSDTGIGIPIDQQKNIFGSFVQQKGQDVTQYGGTGLGLAISKKLVSTMGGTLNLKSEVAKGSTFSVLLENVKIENMPDIIISKNSSEQSRVEFDNATVLVVDDIESNRKLIINAFNGSGLTFLEAANGLQAFTMCETNKPDLVIMDIRMPIMNGVEATQKIRATKQLSAIPIVALTASLKYEHGEIDSLFNGYLHKPIGYNELLLELKKYLPYEIIAIQNKKLPMPYVKDNISLEAFEAIKQNVLPLFKEANKSGVFDDIHKLSTMMTTIAKEHKINILETYAINLEQATQNFDIDAIKKHIKTFLSLYNQLEELKYEK